MIVNDLDCRLIDKLARDEYLCSGFRPLLPHEDSEQHLFEWSLVCERLKRTLTTIGTVGIEADFYVDSDGESTRFLCVEVGNLSLFGNELLRVVHKVVRSSPSPYCIDICDSWGYLQGENGEDYPHFNIFVEPTQVLIYSEGSSAELLSRLGILPGRIHWAD